MKKHIPNFITLCNLACGCLGIVLAFDGQLAMASYCIWIAGLFDFMDGMAARLLKATSPIGKELDSLSDMVSFGVLPSVLAFIMLRQLGAPPYLPYVAFSIALLSALRLAKFNIDPGQSDVFIGLPTPANALFFSALPILYAEGQLPFLNAPILAVLCVLFALMLVANVKLLSLKFKSLSWQANKARFILIGFAVFTILFLQLMAIPIVILGYIVLSLVNNVLSKHKNRV